MTTNFEPTCFDDFLFSNSADSEKLQLILSHKIPLPFAGKSGILLHGTWGTGKSTLATLLPQLLETGYSKGWDFSKGVGQMPPSSSADFLVFNCGGGLTIGQIAKQIAARSSFVQLHNFSKGNYFVFDEFEKLTLSAQQSMRPLMDLHGCQYFLTTNYLGSVDKGIVNRCHLIEMNQMSSLAGYLPLAHSILTRMGVAMGRVSSSTLLGHAKTARGSIRDFASSLLIEGLQNGGALPSP